MPQDSLTVDYMDSSRAYIPVQPSPGEELVIMPGPAVQKDPYMLPPAGVITFLSVFGVVLFKVIRDGHAARSEQKLSMSRGAYSAAEPVQPLKYSGKDLHFSAGEYEEILGRHCNFYQLLNPVCQKKFIQRIKDFIRKKIFIIHDEKGFREMPVLVAAASVQLTFGLDDYLLPHFRYIHIYPEEFLRLHPRLCFLEGNVSGNSIRLSWKHFLKGMQHRDDGQHIGLHEMAHALYYQAFVCENNVDCNFRDFFHDFNEDGNKVYAAEQAETGGLYSEYAVKNFQEFWAESIELFFEKPHNLKTKYPTLYDSLKTLLNQDPSQQSSRLCSQPG